MKKSDQIFLIALLVTVFSFAGVGATGNLEIWFLSISGIGVMVISLFMKDKPKCRCTRDTCPICKPQK